MSGVIGGVFPLLSVDGKGGSLPYLDDPKTICFVNGRSAIRMLVTSSASDRVWLPSYVCYSVVEALSGVEIAWYDVGDELTPVDDDWLDQLCRTDMVLFIDYFGWRTPPAWFERAKARGALILEDASQALLTSRIGTAADFLLMVPRKFVGVPDGALLMATSDRALPALELEKPPAEWWRLALAACEGRSAFDRTGEAKDWYPQFLEAEERQPLGGFGMSPYSRDLLANCFLGEAMASRRRSNYEILAEALSEIALFPELPTTVVPIGFPARTTDRDRVRSALFGCEIYPPVHWDIRDVVPERFASSHALSREIMTLPCDHRYDAADMERICFAVLQEIGA